MFVAMSGCSEHNGQIHSSCCLLETQKKSPEFTPKIFGTTLQAGCQSPPGLFHFFKGNPKLNLRFVASSAGPPGIPGLDHWHGDHCTWVKNLMRWESKKVTSNSLLPEVQPKTYCRWWFPQGLLISSRTYYLSSNLTNLFPMGWTSQLVTQYSCHAKIHEISELRPGPFWCSSSLCEHCWLHAFIRVSRVINRFWTGLSWGWHFFSKLLMVMSFEGLKRSVDFLDLLVLPNRRSFFFLQTKEDVCFRVTSNWYFHFSNIADGGSPLGCWLSSVFFCNLARSQSRYRSSGTNKQEGGRQRPLRKVSYCYMDSTLTEWWPQWVLLGTAQKCRIATGWSRAITSWGW